jgi:formate hydrogenlyase subunit 6/NADH:ubiquinone oxidoreductase subunit I
MFIVGVDCPAPCHAGAFCGDLDTNHAADGFDVMLYPLAPAGPRDDEQGAQRTEAEYGVVFGTAAGRVWLSGADALRPPDAALERRWSDYQSDKQREFPRRLKVRRGELPAVLARSYDSLLWEATAQRCYSCGSCNLVCPTCYCFDVRDENAFPLERGERQRVWEGCMLPQFALVAGGHNFRNRAAQRLRHRMMRKGAWIEQRTGQPGCVGCGRCDRACTARISIVELLNQLAEETGHAHG